MVSGVLWLQKSSWRRTRIGLEGRKVDLEGRKIELGGRKIELIRVRGQSGRRNPAEISGNQRTSAGPQVRSEVKTIVRGTDSSRPRTIALTSGLT